MKTIKLGIFGLGRGGSFFKSVAAAGGTVCAVCERDTERVKAAVSEIGESRTLLVLRTISLSSSSV